MFPLLGKRDCLWVAKDPLRCLLCETSSQFTSYHSLLDPKYAQLMLSLYLLLTMSQTYILMAQIASNLWSGRMELVYTAVLRMVHVCQRTWEI